MSVEPVSAAAGEPKAPHPDDEILARHLTEVVAGAGALARSMFSASLKTWSKGNNSPVTEADLAVDRFLHEKLTALRPHYGWLSEETADTDARLTAHRVWVVDPIDGTRGYMNGAPDWAVSVALVEHGRPLIAALFAPVLDEMFTALRGQGAWRNGSALKIAPRVALEGARTAGPADTLEAMARATPITRLPRGHSLALRLARVATGEVDVALSRADSHDWDLAAADLLVQEAEGCLTTFDNQPLTYNRALPRHAPLVCAGRALHPAAAAAARASLSAPLGAAPPQP